MARKVAPSAYAIPRIATTSRRAAINPFGTNRLQEWEIPVGGTPLGLAAAQFQHETARKFRALINQSQLGSIAEFARSNPGISYERLRAILTGDTWMRLEDMVFVAGHLNTRLILGIEPILLGRERED